MNLFAILASVALLSRLRSVDGLCISSGAAASSAAAPRTGRRLLQTNLESVARVRVVNLSTLPDNNDQDVDETELTGLIVVAPSNEPVQYGAYDLGRYEVAQLNHTIFTELVRSACSTAVDRFPVLR